MDTIQAYWFAASDTLPHGDGRKIIVGETHSLDGEIRLCQHALHGSMHPFDALQYAPGPYLYRTEHWGDIVQEDDKLGSRHRRYLAVIDASRLLYQFARECASDVLHLWNAPQVVKDYLASGDEALRKDAYDAAYDAYVNTHAAGFYHASSAAHAAIYATFTYDVILITADAARSAAAAVAATDARSACIKKQRQRFHSLVEAAFMEGKL